MVIYRLSFFKYLKEKVKEMLSFSGTCKGDIFLNPSMKAGKDILREGTYDDHIIHALRFLSKIKGYDQKFVDLNAGFGAIPFEIRKSFKELFLYEKNEDLRAVLNVNMRLFPSQSFITILKKKTYQKDPLIIRCEDAIDIEHLIQFDNQIIVYQNDVEMLICPPHHEIYHYSAGMDKARPIKTAILLIAKGYAFSLKIIEQEIPLSRGDYIFIPKGLSL